MMMDAIVAMKEDDGDDDDDYDYGDDDDKEDDDDDKEDDDKEDDVFGYKTIFLAKIVDVVIVDVLSNFFELFIDCDSEF